MTPRRGKNAVLFFSSLLFYAWGEPVYLFLMLFSILGNFLVGLRLASAAEKIQGKSKEPKAWLFFAVFLNIGLLGFFKYADFLIEMVNAAAGTSFAVLDLPLPLGISFYTFQALSYIIDLYRKRVPVQRNLIDFGAYVALFPQLIAGPIVRFSDVAEQLRGRRESFDGFSEGVRRFVAGLAKKVLLANQAGAIFDLVRSAESPVSGLTAWIGIIAFTFQIYFDFSGYSDMAIGLGKMFGFTFPENFEHPYMSRSITEFWRRWHMTLGTWFREYVYIPLGGNRKGAVRQIVNLCVVWALTGIWHGASWNFVFWGLYFGVLLIAEKFVWLRCLERMPSLLQHVYTMALVIVSWVIFSLSGVEETGAFLSSMFIPQHWVDGQALYLLRSNGVLLLIMAAGATCLPLNLVKRSAERLSGSARGEAVRAVAEAAFTGGMLLLITAYLVSSSYNPFLYFRF